MDPNIFLKLLFVHPAQGHQLDICECFPCDVIIFHCNDDDGDDDIDMIMVGHFTTVLAMRGSAGPKV